MGRNITLQDLILIKEEDIMDSGELYNYYGDNDFLPTAANFVGNEELLKYELTRKELFFKLKIPLVLFRDARLIEFGPDSGENAVLFAKWGAQLSIVEPNSNAKMHLLKNFERFGLSNNLCDFSDSPLQHFFSSQAYDILVAEGFIFTICPNSLWIEKCASLLKSGGLMFFSYIEAAGAVFDLLLKVMYQYASEVLNEDSVGIAQLLFGNKWDSIPHTRTFHSWFMDVIKNPYYRYPYLNHADALILECERLGLSLYSSWPMYEDGLHVSWHKTMEASAAKINRIEENIKRSNLSYLLGEKCFYIGSLEKKMNQFIGSIQELVKLIDAQVDGIDREKISQAIFLVDTLLQFIGGEPFYFDEGGLDRCSAKLNMLKDILKLICLNEYEKFLLYCQTNKTFISTWGMPNHQVVLRR